MSKKSEHENRIHELEHEIYEAVEIAYLRGASDWVRTHYPQHYSKRLRHPIWRAA